MTKGQRLGYFCLNGTSWADWKKKSWLWIFILDKMPCHKVLSRSPGGFGYCPSPSCLGAASTGVLLKPDFVTSMGFTILSGLTHSTFWMPLLWFSGSYTLGFPAHFWTLVTFPEVGWDWALQRAGLALPSCRCSSTVCSRLGTQPGSGPAVLQQRWSFSRKTVQPQLLLLPFTAWEKSSPQHGKVPPAALQTQGTFITRAVSFHAFT